MKVPRSLLGTGAVVVATTVLVGVADGVVAARAEHAVSIRVRPPTDGVAEPLVTIGAWPYTTAVRSGHLDGLTIRVEGVARPRVGPVTVVVEATDVGVPPGTDLDTATPHAGRVGVTVQLTGDVLARALGLTGVVLSSARDSSMAGGVEHAVRLSGTDPTDGHVVAGAADLVVDARGARLTSPDPRLSLDLPTDLLPLGVRVTDLTVRSGTISATGRAEDRDLPLAEVAADAPGR